MTPVNRRNERNADSTRINNHIRERQVRVISETGEQLGVLTIDAALDRAREVGLDLVEVAATEKPPVCRIMDYGKYKYEKSKKKHSQSSAHQTKLKEIRLRPKTGDHDIQFKLKQAVSFLKHKDKVQVSVIFRGREMAHVEEGLRVMEGVLEQLLQHGKLESSPQQMGRRMMCTVAPK
ncbi:MAG: translation initiation factor IF-3 [Pirellulaceae bacterium]|nr:translation initiation factor IF-3 [Pirellulaceae bacterium]